LPSPRVAMLCSAFELPCFALPCNAPPVPRCAQLRPCYAFLCDASPCHCSAKPSDALLRETMRCLYDALLCLALPSRCQAMPSRALPLAQLCYALLCPCIASPSFARPCRTRLYNASLLLSFALLLLHFASLRQATPRLAFAQQCFGKYRPGRAPLCVARQCLANALRRVATHRPAAPRFRFARSTPHCPAAQRPCDAMLRFVFAALYSATHHAAPADYASHRSAVQCCATPLCSAVRRFVFRYATPGFAWHCLRLATQCTAVPLCFALRNIASPSQRPAVRSFAVLRFASPALLCPRNALLRFALPRPCCALPCHAMPCVAFALPDRLFRLHRFILKSRRIISQAKQIARPINIA